MDVANNAKYNNPEWIGKRYGKLVITGFDRVERKKGKQWYWKVLCDCGTEKMVEPCNVLSGHTLSCGCMKTHYGAITHGETYTRLHMIWDRMRQRCNPAYTGSREYPYYAGRGIRVCGEWMEYTAFAEWAKGNGYNDKLTLERIDNNGNYCPENCRWVGKKEQARNRRTTFYVHYLGRDMSLSEACELAGMPYKTVFARIRDMGWSVEDALSVPVGEKRK